MAELTAALDDALAGHGRVVMLVGEPGIGKTRTAEELARIAQGRGTEVFWGRCPEERGAPPYWPWAQVIRAHVEASKAEPLRIELGRDAAVVADVVSAVSEKLAGLEPAPVISDPESARFRLYDSIATFLKRASQTRPLVIILDDLHWADGSSLRLLEFVASEIASAQVFLLGTYRDVEVSAGHPLSRTLGELTRQRLFGRVLLRGIEQGPTAELMAAYGGVAPAAELVSFVQRQTEGNPLFIRETVRLLASDGMLTAERMADPKSWRFRLPEGVREVIGNRLARLSRECRELLALAAVIGRDFRVALLAHLRTGWPEQRLFDLLDEALAARVIAERAGRPGEYEFTHALIQRALAESLSLTRRVRMHAQVAEALEALHGQGADEHAAELASHYAEAETVTGPEKALRYSMLAGEQALAVYAHEEALAHFESALALKEGRPMDAETAALLFGKARAQLGDLERGNVHLAIATAAPAFDHYVQTGETASALAIAEYPFAQQFGYPGPLNSLLARALHLVPPDSPRMASLLIRYAGSMVSELADTDGARKALNRALAIAQRENAKALEVRALLGMSGAYSNDLQFAEGVQFDSKATEVARGAGLSEIVANSLSGVMPVIARLVTGDLQSARARERDLPATAEGHYRRRFNTAAMGVVHALVARAVGDWTGARRFVEMGLHVSPKDVRLLASRIFAEYEVGDFDEGEAYVTQMVESMRAAPRGPSLEYSLTASTVALADYIRAEVKWSEAAREAADVVLTSKHALRFALQDAKVGLALVAVVQGDAQSAAEQYRELEGYPHLMLPNMKCHLGRVLGLLSRTMGDHVAAARHFEQTLTFCRKAGYAPELGWTCHDYAETMLSAPGGLDGTKVRELLAEGAPIAERLGMKPLAARLAGQREKLAARRGDQPEFPNGLTARQAEVLRLIADGKTNREIAVQLVLSQRTVQRHIADVYAKIGARNRAEATAFALRELGSPERPPLR